MAIYQIANGNAQRIRLSEFKLEKDLQRVIEANLEIIFNCKLIATEFATGQVHSGRIDTLAISEDNNPVIIEYKKVASSELINQSLYYLHWITDHKGDFQIAVNKKLGGKIDVDWSEVRVICIAPEYKKYDLHAVQVIGANIELWQYKFYENEILNLEEVYRRTEPILVAQHGETKAKSPIMVEAGKKAAIARKNSTYTIEEHSDKLVTDLAQLFEDVREYIMAIDAAIEETPKKFYISYKTSQNFVCLEARKNKLILYLKINPGEIQPFPKQCRDVRNIGHFGTGDLELILTNKNDIEETKTLIIDSFKNIGG